MGMVTTATEDIMGQATMAMVLTMAAVPTTAVAPTTGIRDTGSSASIECRGELPSRSARRSATPGHRGSGLKPRVLGLYLDNVQCPFWVISGQTVPDQTPPLSALVQ